MVAEKQCPTILLDDAPASSDAFGSHQRVADAVTEVVQTEIGGRSIGLEGGWGSGKSTVVQLVKQKLSKLMNPKFQVATFDMWAHQDDPLRRTFLENLIEQLRTSDWVDDKEWELQQDELAGRRRVDTTSVVPRLTVAGGWFALTLLVIPVGAAMISAAVTLWTAETPPSNWVIAPLLVLGAVLAFAPGIYYGAWRWLSGKKRREEGLNDLPALVMGQASTKTSTIVTETPDPTSVEFETIFGHLLSEALIEKPRKLLLVVDNLDRVGPSDALSIWSTLQTFLGHSDYSDADWIDQLWVLIPYDEGAILRLWDGSVKQDGENTKSLLATSFLDKTFQIRFRVPQLLLSNWRGFLREKLQQALPKHNEDDFHGVYRAFAAKGRLERSAPTPRDLKIFVNQIGAMHRKWQGDFRLSDFACYTLLQKDGVDVHKILLEADDRDFLRRIVGHRWQEIIGALHFGVPVQEANQLLLRGPIEAALTEGDGKALTELASVHAVGFWSVLEQSGPFGANVWSDLRPAELAICATALAECEVFVSADGRHEAESLKSVIRESALALDSWEPFIATTAQGMIAVAKLVGESENIVAALLKGATNSPVVNEANPRVWMSSAFALLEGLTRLGFGERLGEGVGVSLGAQQWLEISHEIGTRDPHGQLLQYLELQNAPAIDDGLAELLESNQLDTDSFYAVQTAMATKTRTAFSKTANAVFDNFVSGDSVSGDPHAGLLKLVRYSKSVGLVTEDQLAESESAGHYLHHFYSAYSEGHAEAEAESMFGFLQMVPDAEEPAPVGNSSSGYQSLNQLLEDPDIVSGSLDYFTNLVRESDQLPMVWETAQKRWPNAPFLSRVLNNLIDSKSVVIPHGEVRANWYILKDALENSGSQNFPTFLKELPELRELVGGVINSTFDADESGLYLYLLRCQVGKDFLAWCIDGLKGVRQNEWQTEIEEEGYLVDLAVELKNGNPGLSLGVGFSDALTEFAELVAKNNDESLTDETWYQLLGFLNSDQREMFARRAYKMLVESNGETNAKFFKIIGSVTVQRYVLSDEMRFVYEVFTPIIDADNAAGFKWIAEILGSDPSLLVYHRDIPARDEFADRVRQRMSNTPEDDAKFEDLVKIGHSLPVEVSRDTAAVEATVDADDEPNAI